MNKFRFRCYKINIEKSKYHKFKNKDIIFYFILFLTIKYTRLKTRKKLKKNP